MAEALLRREAGDRFDIHSGGLRPRSIHPLTLRVLDEEGLDTSRLSSTDLGRFLGKVPIHFAITVCEAANADCPRLHPFALRQLYWPFPDPVAAEGSEEERLAAFRGTRDAIADRIRQWLQDELPGTQVRPSIANCDA
jgi:arsenate reductase